jgi:glycosyltransferase involved in cell wall biosynthesis
MSRIHAKKGVDLLVRAYARVRAEHGAWSREHGATARAETGGLRPEGEQKERAEPKSAVADVDGRRQTGGLNRSGAEMAEGKPEDGAELQVSGFMPQVLDFPDLVIAGPGWESRYGEEVRMLIDEVNEAFRDETGNLRAEGMQNAECKMQNAEGEKSETAEGGDPHAGGQAAAATKTENCRLNTEPRFGETAPRQHFARVHAIGMLAGDSKWGALYGCEAFVLPSHQENFGIAVVEALACGKPVLISDQVNIWREIVEDGAGLVEEDTEEGVEKLLRRFFHAQRAETGGLRLEVENRGLEAGGGPDGVVSPSQAERAEASGRSAFAPSDSGVTRSGPRACYLKRFAIAPAAAKLAEVVKHQPLIDAD